MDTIRYNQNHLTAQLVVQNKHIVHKFWIYHIFSLWIHWIECC